MVAKKNIPETIPVIFVILVVLLLRLPSHFEPYWYGDEGIYLTLGLALRHGVKLYAEIIDHKTPIIYYLAMVPSQFWFRVLTTVWMLITTTAFYVLASRLFRRVLPTLVASVLFALFTSIPRLEGNIPNGELFVMGFILMGAVTLIKTSIWQTFLLENKAVAEKKSETGWFLATGLFFGLAILTKVPALFDAVAFLALGWFITTRELLTSARPSKQLLITVKNSVTWMSIVAAAVICTIGGSILYFMSRGSGTAYLDYGLLYNFHYVQTWSLPFSNPFLSFAFSLLGKVGIAGCLLLVLTGIQKKISPAVTFSASWLILALVATLLSNRPYPHYFLQLVPPASLLVGAVLLNWKNKVNVAIALTLGLLIWTVLKLLNVGYYQTLPYYQNSYRYLTGSLSQADYYQTFDSLMSDNYRAAPIIARSNSPTLFIWGTNPMLYAQSQKYPVGRFTVSFHIKDFKAYQETIDAVRSKQPDYIVVMNNETEPLEGLTEYLSAHYAQTGTFDHFVLWQRQ